MSNVDTDSENYSFMGLAFYNNAQFDFFYL